METFLPTKNLEFLIGLGGGTRSGGASGGIAEGVVARITTSLLVVSVVVPTVMPRDSLVIIAGHRARYPVPLKHNGQRWRALAVRDYESRALPLSYGGGCFRS